MRKTLISAAALLGLFSTAALAHEYQVAKLHIDHPWALELPPVSANGAAYLVVHNNGDTPDRLVGADTPRAGKTEIHEHVHKDGVMKMQQVDGGLAIPAGGEVRLEQGGYHLMMFGLKQPLKDGERFPMTLHFEKAGDLKVDIAVQKTAPAAEKTHAHGEHAEHGDHSQHSGHAQ